jgi:hypothetical protein
MWTEVLALHVCQHQTKGHSPGELDRVATVETFKGKGFMAMGPQAEDIINKPEPKVLVQRSHE